MFYIIYKSTHLESGRFYVGMHQTKYPNDGYLGSGTLISRAVKKYGKEALKKEILFTFDNPEEMRAKEKDIVTEEFLKDPLVYNLNVGGDGGWYRASKIKSWKAKNDPSYRSQLQRQGSNLLKKLWAEGRIDPNTFQGRHHTQETKAKIGAFFSKNQAGSHNSQFGTVWICKPGEKPRKASKNEIPEGWHLGRRQEPKPPRERQWVSKPGEKPRQVILDELPSLLREGWTPGRRVC